MTHLCEDCGGHATWSLESARDSVVVPPDVTTTASCDAHRLDVTERLLNLYGNATISEDLG